MNDDACRWGIPLLHENKHMKVVEMGEGRVRGLDSFSILGLGSIMLGSIFRLRWDSEGKDCSLKRNLGSSGGNFVGF